jgi:hypothetical protein
MLWRKKIKGVAGQPFTSAEVIRHVTHGFSQSTVKQKLGREMR